MTTEVAWFEGSRSDLRWLYELAEDSAVQLDAYIDEGRVLVAREGSGIVGHLQLVSVSDSDAREIKSLAVDEEEQGRGIGRLLVEKAVSVCAAEGVATLLVSTATADVGNLRFYQRCGFRMLTIERDAFVPATGYPDPIEIEGIPLRDRVWLSLDVA